MTTSPPAFGTRYVRALYDYEADNRYNLSFHAGQLIQVITELENGWWDGVTDGVRGWFPSNYCEMSPDLDDAMERDQNGNREMEEDSDEEEEEEEYYEDEYEDDESDSEDDDLSELQVGKSSYSDRTRVDFWIPQASSDGSLFYFNTMTGESSMTLPQENSETEHEDTPPLAPMKLNLQPSPSPPPAVPLPQVSPDSSPDPLNRKGSNRPKDRPG
jgi:son of sevenless-like protein